MSSTSQNQGRSIPINIGSPQRRARPKGDSVLPERRRYRFTDQQLLHSLETTLSSSKTVDVLLTNIAKLVVRESDCLALWACQADENNEFGKPHLLTHSDGDIVWSLVEDHVREMINRVKETRQICSSPISGQNNSELIVTPICLDSGIEAPIRMMFVGCFSTNQQSSLRQQWLLGLVSQTVTRWFQQRRITHQESMSSTMNDSFGLIHALDQTKTLSEAAILIANHLRKLCAAEQVAVSFCDEKGNGTLKAVSDVESVDLNSESNRVINHACNQALGATAALQFPPAEGNPSPEHLALDKYCKSNGLDACLAVPLRTADGKTIGSVLLGTTQAQLQDENYQVYAGRLVEMIAGHVDVVVRANRSLRDITKQRVRAFFKDKLFKLCLIGAIAIAGIMMIPMPYRVACDCEVQPVMRRFIASPYDGILDKSNVESGDLVTENQIIALLDGRQLRIELSGLRAEFDGAKKRRDSALAQGDVASSHIARSEMKRHEAKIAILEQQLENLEVKSPIAGIVVKGDLEKVEGAPLEMGQTMFEIAPLDEMVAEIGIPESEIQYVESGMKVAIKLNAFPFKTWEGEIQSIYPRTEIFEDESVFIAQVKLPNELSQLRPGMKGTAKVKTSWAPIGWNLFHRPWESIRYWMIW